MITKKTITKDKVRKLSADQRGPNRLSSSGGGSRVKNNEDGSSLRTKNAPQRRRQSDTINLEKLTSEEFNALLENSSDDTDEEASKKQKEKKATKEMQQKNALKRNEEVLKLPNLHNVEQTVTQEPKSPPAPQNEIPKSTEDIMENSSVENNETSSGVIKDIIPKLASDMPDSLPVTPEKCKSIGVETDPTTVFCGCPRCTDLLRRFYALARDARTEPCTGSALGGLEAFHPNEQWPNNEMSVHDTSTSPSLTAKGGEKLVPLIEGCKVMISLTKKSKIKHKIVSGDPQDYVNELMNIFFTPEEMAKMTAEGRTPGSVKMDIDIKDAILAYVSHKYDRKKYNFSKNLLTDFINAKCYCERRKLWKKGSNDETETSVTKRQKRVRKSGESPNNNDGETAGKKRHKNSKYKSKQNSPKKINSKISPFKKHKKSLSWSPALKTSGSRRNSNRNTFISTPVEFENSFCSQASSPSPHQRTSSRPEQSVLKGSRVKRAMLFDEDHSSCPHPSQAYRSSSPSMLSYDKPDSVKRFSNNSERKSYSDNSSGRKRGSSHSHEDQKNYTTSTPKKGSPNKSQRPTTAGKRPKEMYLSLEKYQRYLSQERKKHGRNSSEEDFDEDKIQRKNARRAIDYSSSPRSERDRDD